MESIGVALDRQVRELKELNEILFGDVRWHLDHNDHSQRSYRSTIRAIGAWTDGLVAGLMGTLTAVKIVRNAATVSDDELAQLLDHRRIPAFAGKKRRRFTLEELTKVALKAFSEACGVKFDLSAHSVKWQQFATSIKIRHRVTHPKTPTDLHIEPEDMKQAAEAATWLQEVIAEIADNRKTKPI